MMTHKRTHFSASVKEGYKFSCNICGKELYSKWGVLRHKQSFHNDRFPHQCKICGKKYKVDVTLKRHLLTHGEPRFRCKVCCFLITLYLFSNYLVLRNQIMLCYLFGYKTGFSLSRMTTNNRISPMEFC